ncbi:MAG TPA: hypothetical protein VMB73_06010 [Acetobacteraceae bacterium]|nr:hypothetical protein [Acetobacteraceae bacterium]
MTRFAVIRAVVSISALGTWAAVRAYPMVWGGIIAAAQVADALQNAIPFAARFRGTNALLAALEALLIDCQMEWEVIFAGRLDENGSPRDTAAGQPSALSALASPSRPL